MTRRTKPQNKINRATKPEDIGRVLGYRDGIWAAWSVPTSERIFKGVRHNIVFAPTGMQVAGANTLNEAKKVIKLLNKRFPDVNSEQDLHQLMDYKTPFMISVKNGDISHLVSALSMEESTIVETFSVKQWNKIDNHKYEFTADESDFVAFVEPYRDQRGFDDTPLYEVSFAWINPDYDTDNYDFLIDLGDTDATDIIMTVMDIVNSEIKHDRFTLAFSPTKSEKEKSLYAKNTKRGSVYARMIKRASEKYHFTVEKIDAAQDDMMFLIQRNDKLSESRMIKEKIISKFLEAPWVDFPNGGFFDLELESLPKTKENFVKYIRDIFSGKTIGPTEKTPEPLQLTTRSEKEKFWKSISEDPFFAIYAKKILKGDTEEESLNMLRKKIEDVF